MRGAAAAALLAVVACRGGGGWDEARPVDRVLPPVTDELVVVRADAWLYLQPSEKGARVQAVAARAHAGDARVFALVARRDDGWVELENAPEDEARCYRELDVRDYRLRFFVLKGDVLPVTTAPVALAELRDASEIAIAPGAAVVDGRIELPVATVTLAKAPATADAYRAGPTPPGRAERPRTEQEEAARLQHPWNWVGELAMDIYDLGGGVSVKARPNATGGRRDGMVTVEDGCVRLRLVGAQASRSNGPDREHVRRLARDLLRTDAGPGARTVPAGSPVRLEDGTVVGTTARDVSVAARCGEIAVEAGQLTLCHDVKP